MKVPGQQLIDIEIDKLTNSIDNVVTGDSFRTAASPVSAADLRTTTKKAGWQFNWREEFKQPERAVFKLTIEGNPNIVQGLTSLEVMADHVYMHLIESAPFNLGKHKVYAGVPGNLFAHACQLAFQHGHEGNVGLVSKTRLIDHYTETLGAEHMGGHRMVIDTPAALWLIKKYFTQ